MAINFNKAQLRVLIEQRKERVAHYQLLWENPTKSQANYLKNIASELELWEKKVFELENPHLVVKEEKPQKKKATKRKKPQRKKK